MANRRQKRDLGMDHSQYRETPWSGSVKVNGDTFRPLCIRFALFDPFRSFSQKLILATANLFNELKDGEPRTSGLSKERGTLHD